MISLFQKKLCLDIDQCIKDNQALLNDVKLPWNQPICRNSTYHQVKNEGET